MSEDRTDHFATTAPEPTAIIAIRPSLCGEMFEFRLKQLERYADRLAYRVLAVFDTDKTPNLWLPITKWQPDAVITLDENHIQLTEVARISDVITLLPEAQYSQGRYELLDPNNAGDANPTLPQRNPGASGLVPHPNSMRPVPARAVTATDWGQVLRILLGVRRARTTAPPTA
ncbi:hypothetical protein [Nocardia macrotermitis]|uniref:Uncharacterized protein n=1 Tax=Nocardia macrotermitis TaxID=2585198 RepID=A0A7K0D0V5_9NOCA|nr:hypothetical protein [Nocardia macrotermitis]MQY19350.1 hypothetical protein [Nocardia macrotermitis]